MADSQGPVRYRTLEREGSWEFTEKKSRFLGYAAPALREEDALRFVESVRSRHPGCSAVLFAYACGFRGEAQRFHDAHEPSGGLLMLEALKRAGVCGAVTAVVRYYGGVQLGAGPLGRAFGQAAAQAIDAAHPCEVERTLRFAVECDYALGGKLEHALAHSPHRLLGLEYGECVRAQVEVRQSLEDRFRAEMRDLTAGQSQPELLDERYSRWE